MPGEIRRWLRVFVAACAVAAAGWLVPAPSSATPGLLTNLPGYCRSYAYDCVSGGYAATAATTGNGWAWRYYGEQGAGGIQTTTGPHNCTLYVAWRLQQAGMPDPGHAWGDASYWGSALGYDRNPTVGSVAWWQAGDHVAYVEQVSADRSQVYVRADNFVGDGSYKAKGLPNSGAAGYTDSGWINASGPTGFLHPHDTPGTVSDGQFVSYAGNVYRVAGGAPVYVSSWNSFGGAQPTTALSDAQFASLRAVPADGTFIAGQASGRVFIVAGGSPQYVSSWDVYGGSKPVVYVDDVAIDNAGAGGVFDHLRTYPADGTMLSAQPSGRVYRVAGGAPLYVASWAGIGGSQPTVPVVDAIPDNAGSADVTWGHLRASPTDMFIRGYATGSVYRVVSGGHPYWVSSWTPYGGVQPYVDVDQWAIDQCDHLNCSPWGDVNAVSDAGESVAVRGWAMDSETVNPLTIHVYVDGTFAGAGTANAVRTDVDAVFHRGANFGYDFTVPSTPGSREVCVYALNTGHGSNAGLGCKQVTVTTVPQVGSVTTPTVTGTPQVGAVLTTTPGIWAQSGVTVAYQWLRGSNAVPGATGATYSPGPDDLGAVIRVRVTASKSGYKPTSATSAPTAAVGPGVLTLLRSPAVSGRARVGRTLRTTVGTWSVGGLTVGYQWLRGTHAIPGATGAAYRVRRADAGHRLRVRVTVSRAGYRSASVASPRTNTVQ